MNLKKRIEKLELQGVTDIPMVALKNADGSILRNGSVYSDSNTFDSALQESGVGGRLILFVSFR